MPRALWDPITKCKRNATREKEGHLKLAQVALAWMTLRVVANEYIVKSIAGDGAERDMASNYVFVIIVYRHSCFHFF